MKYRPKDGNEIRLRRGFDKIQSSISIEAWLIKSTKKFDFTKIFRPAIRRKR